LGGSYGAPGREGDKKAVKAGGAMSRLGLHFFRPLREAS
jgi:hypothetical protein